MAKSLPSFRKVRTDLNSTHREELKSVLRIECNHLEGGATDRGSESPDFLAEPDVRRDPLVPSPGQTLEHGKVVDSRGVCEIPIFRPSVVKLVYLRAGPEV